MLVDSDRKADIAAMTSIAVEQFFYSLKFKVYHDLFIPLIIIFGISITIIKILC